jgi:hypothetical protein
MNLIFFMFFILGARAGFPFQGRSAKADPGFSLQSLAQHPRRFSSSVWARSTKVSDISQDFLPGC